MRAYRQSVTYAQAMCKRTVWVEPLFAEAKAWHGLRRFRLRRLWRVNCEALLTAAGQNLKRLLAKRGWGRRPLPSGAAALAVTRHDTRWLRRLRRRGTHLGGEPPQPRRRNTKYHQAWTAASQ